MTDGTLPRDNGDARGAGSNVTWLTESLAALKAAIAPAAGVSSTLDGAPSEPAAEGRLARMGVPIGDLNLLIPADAGREVIAPPPISRVPHTAAWLRGLANVRGNLIPVVDLNAVAGAYPSASTSTYLLISGQGDTALGLLIDGLPRLLQVDAAERASGHGPVPALLEPAVVAAYRHDARVWLDVDLQVLFDNFTHHIAL